MKICGVYKITNVITGDFYIGSSVDVYSRFTLHMKRDVNRYAPKNHPFYVDILNYGSENFKLEILEECNREDKIKREQYWYDELHPTYNKVRPTECNFIYPEVRELSNKISHDEEHMRARKELYNSPKYKEFFRTIHKDKMKPCIMMDLNGNDLLEFISFQEASRYITENTNFKGKNKSSKIKAVCDGERTTAYGFKWKYKNV